MFGWAHRRQLATTIVFALLLGAGGAASATPGDKPPNGGGPSPQATATTTAAGFAFGQLQAKTVGHAGCGTNIDGEPAIRIGYDGNVIIASERGLSSGSDAWHARQTGGTGASACALSYAGQPNAVAGNGASGGDTDVAIASARIGAGNANYRLYVASLNGGSVSVAHSDDGGGTYTNVPVQAGLPGDDREWIAAYADSTSLITFHDIATQNINVLRSDNGGFAYTQIGEALNPSTQAGINGLLANQHGNLAIDRRTTAGTQPHGPLAGFWAYQSYVAPSTTNTNANFNEAYMAVSSDGGFTWTDKEIPCSNRSANVTLDNQFPIVSVAPDGAVWMTWAAGTRDGNGNVVSGAVYTARSIDHGNTWSCSGAIAGGSSSPAVMPWIAATSAGVDVVFYQATSGGRSGTWSVRFAQDLAGTPTGWGTPVTVVAVHKGAVCELGFTCNGGRQLFDDFGVATDPSGWAHIAYSSDAPSLGKNGTFTGDAVQTSGSRVGTTN